MQVVESAIGGPLQARIMILLRDEALCGKDMMRRLRIRSPGTIYPVLETMRKKRVIDYKLEQEGPIRKKVYFLTKDGEQQLREQLVDSARRYCCDATLHLRRILENLNGMVQLKRNQKVLSTLEFDEVKRFLRGANVTFSYDLNVPPSTFDLALSFLGVGCLIGRKSDDVTSHLRGLYRSLKKSGTLLAVEVEKTDNMFASIFFEDIMGLREIPGLTREELDNSLSKTGFQDTILKSKSGLLYAVSHKN